MNNTISFLDVQVTRKADGTLAHTVHRKPTHTDRYLHSSSFHHPHFKSAVRNTLFHRVFSTCDQHSLKQELHHVKTSLQLTDTSILTSTSPSQASHQKNDHSSSPPSLSRTSATHHTSYSASSAKLKSGYFTRHQTRLKHHYKHTRTNKTHKTHKTRLVFTAFPVIVNAVKYTSERQGTAYM